jgi:hypothetical protein
MSVCQDAGQQLYIMNGADPLDLVKNVCLEDVFEDVICEVGDTDIAEPGDRFNRGVSIGISGCQSVEKHKSKVGLAQPVVMKGTSRYPNLFCKMTSCGMDLMDRARKVIEETEEDNKAVLLGAIGGS